MLVCRDTNLLSRRVTREDFLRVSRRVWTHRRAFLWEVCMFSSRLRGLSAESKCANARLSPCARPPVDHFLVKGRLFLNLLLWEAAHTHWCTWALSHVSEWVIRWNKKPAVKSYMNKHLLQAQRHVFNNVLAIIGSCMQLQQMLYNGHVTGAGLDPLKVTAENHWRNFFHKLLNSSRSIKYTGLLFTSML